MRTGRREAERASGLSAERDGDRRSEGVPVEEHCEAGNGKGSGEMSFVVGDGALGWDNVVFRKGESTSMKRKCKQHLAFVLAILLGLTSGLGGVASA